MPYFIILPAYAALLAGLIIAALLSLAFKPLRQLSGYILAGALGTIPGFILGNVAFWAALFAAGTLVPESLAEFDFGEWTTGIAIGFGLLAVLGLVVANAVGCLAGFLGGVWAFAAIRRTTPANKRMNQTIP